MSIYNLEDGRALCWDEFFIDKQSRVKVTMHEPVRKEAAVVCDGECDGNTNGYGAIIQADGKYTFRYRACNVDLFADGTLQETPMVYCLMESQDGKKFKKKILRKFPYNGDTYNHIFHMEKRYLDNFAVFYDENPNCPESERYKALSMVENRYSDKYEKYLGEDFDTRIHTKVPDLDEKKVELALYTSADGIDFDFKRMLDLGGGYDSYNVLLWDDTTEQYYIYYRYNHIPGLHGEPVSREIRVCTSKDLVNFEFLGAIDFGDADDSIQLYTSQVVRYKRAKDMFIGFPMRYIQREEEAFNFEQFPRADKKKLAIEKVGRMGHAVTDCAIMISRDGKHFNRRDEAYIRPGIESETNWWYGDCAMAYGIVETESDTPGNPNELSIYVTENYRMRDVNWARYTVRMDGFFSWYADYKGGEVLTKPFTFTGDELEINFSTSALGALEIDICDEDGNVLEGYQSGVLFGDSIDRKVAFSKNLKELNGRAVRLAFKLKDCHLYSFKFNK